ncbi:hypothetical protein QN277_011825 [Acacia crassicarpa]|uniref:Protein kinase domain-containing protein n=1 Tax=Acacia crassicarpa TaxID=499986 RepID=A0AAE1MZU6_9FABA|nr:hypothetical protein QN277_011825 [Acacia crassicarpa]
MDHNVQAVLAAVISFFVVTLIFAAIIFLCKSNTKTHPRQRQYRAPTQNRTQPELSSVVVDGSWSFDPYVQFTWDEITKSTNNFSPDLIIGDGSFGLVYKARLSNGLVVAIKKLSPDAFQGFREFRAEMETLAKLRHPNIVKILGYWSAGQERMLVYEFMERGNLDQWFHDPTISSSFGHGDVSMPRAPLSWGVRLKIIRGIANGLFYLHGLEKPIIHRDIKASNVLLDSEFEAHIADFGLARRIDTSHSHVSTQFAGTMGYMPPEYRDGVNVANVKVDVYSFGVLMLETATGRRPNLSVKFENKDIGLVQWARKMEAQNAQMEMVDPNISREGISEDGVKEYFRIACKCTSELQKDRPVMQEVVEWFEKMAM